MGMVLRSTSSNPQIEYFVSAFNADDEVGVGLPVI